MLGFICVVLQHTSHLLLNKSVCSISKIQLASLSGLDIMPKTSLKSVRESHTIK